jgi:hypothetical protein
MELRDLWLELRTSVWASEKAVSHRWGASVTGWEYVVSTTGSSTTNGTVDGPAALSPYAGCLVASSACCHGLLDAALCLPSLADEFLRPVRGGVASIEPARPSWGGEAARGLLWDRDGGLGALLGFGKRENPPAGCGCWFGCEDMSSTRALLSFEAQWRGSAVVLPRFCFSKLRANGEGRSIDDKKPVVPAT